MLRFLRNKLMLGKTYISRTVTYLSVINSGMILFLFLSRLKEAGYIQADLDKYYILIIVVGIIILLFLGWFDVNYLKGMQEEATISFSYQPPMVEMKDKIDEIYKDFREQKEKKDVQQ